MQTESKFNDKQSNRPNELLSKILVVKGLGL